MINNGFSNKRITNSIINILNQQGYSGIITDSIKYCLEENLKYLFGNNIDINNFSLSIYGNIIEIRSIFDDFIYQIFTGYDTQESCNYIRCNQIEEGHSTLEFQISISENGFQNLIYLTLDSKYPQLKVKVLSYERDTNKFVLEYKTITNGMETINYKAFLQSINIQIKDKELLCFNREVPVLNTDNIFKKVVDELKGKGNTRIVTTDYNPHDIETYSEIMFSELETDASNILKHHLEEKKQDL